MPTQKGKVKKTIELWEGDFEWLEAEFNNPSLSYIVGCLVRALRMVCEKPEEYNLKTTGLMEQAREAARMTKEEISDS